MPKTPPKLLTKKKEAWAKQWKPTKAIRGTPLNFNAALQERYERELRSMVKLMTTTYRKELTALFKTDPAINHFGDVMDASIASQARILTNRLTARFNQLFAKRAFKVASNMVNGAERTSKSNVHSSMQKLSGGLSLKTSVISGTMKETMTASVAENVSLIKSIPQKYSTDVAGAVMRSITAGNGLQDLIPALEKYEGQTERRARNIALDQTRKAYNSLNKGRLQAIGVKKFEWLHTGGSQKPRQEHIDMSGQVYRFDDPPIIDYKTGERGFPGQLPNCKCRMVPVIEFDTGEQE